MIRYTTRLWVILLFTIYIQRNYAATIVKYEFHIREATGNRDEQGVLKDNPADSRAEPELIITGKRYASAILLAKDPVTEFDYIFLENATYVADDSGYHVKYNFTLEPLTPDKFDTRLDGKTLKSTIG